MHIVVGGEQIFRRSCQALLLATVASGLLWGCGCQSAGGTPPSPPIPRRTCPGWVDKGGGFFKGARGHAFYGVGASSGMASPSMVAHRRKIADTMAREALARTIKTSVEGLVKSYSSVLGSGERTEFERYTEEVTRSLVSMKLARTRIIDRCWEPSEQTQYSLVIMDLDGFKRKVRRLAGLRPRAQELILRNADAAFGELDKRLRRARRKR